MKRLIAIALSLLLAACATTPTMTPTDKLEVLSWWTSGSERDAFSVFVDGYKAGQPGVDVQLVEVSGGSGSNAQVVLAQRLATNTPPDVWQTFPGGAVAGYVRANQIADISSVYTDAMKQNLPPAVLDGLQVNGKFYGVPTSSHRGNVLFYNRALLARAGITSPATTLDGWLSNLATLKQAGVTPLCLGAKDAFTTPAVFENILLSVVGSAGWDAIRADRFDWGSADVATALRGFSTALDNADPQAASLSWDQAAAKLSSGGCAYLTMNDSAYGEIVRAGGVPDQTFGAIPFPGTDSVYTAVVDTFVVAAAAKNGTNAMMFVTSLSDPARQTTFSKIKGSVPIRLDADVSSLSPYQQQAAQALRTKQVQWSIVHGSATTPRFQQGFYDAVGTYVRSRDQATFTRTLSDSVAAQPPNR